MLLPVVVPDFVLSFSWLRAYGRGGLHRCSPRSELDGCRKARSGSRSLSWSTQVPLSYLIVAVGLAARAEPAAERAARVSGASPWTVLRTITLPLLRPAIAHRSRAWCSCSTLGTFAIPQVMGSPGGFFTVTTRIYAYLARSSDPEELPCGDRPGAATGDHRGSGHCADRRAAGSPVARYPGGDHRSRHRCRRAHC